MNFEVINIGFSQIISCTHGGFPMHHGHTGRHPFSVFFSQVFQSLFYHSSGLLVCSLGGFCYHFGVVFPSFRQLYCSVSEGLPIQVVLPQ